MKYAALKYFVVPMLLGLSHPINVTAVPLAVPQVFQEQTHWCWAACSKAVLQYYGHVTYNGTPMTQILIADYGTNGANTQNLLFGQDETHKGVDMILNHFGNILSQGINTPKAWSEVYNSINNAFTPIPIGWVPSHMVVVSDAYYYLRRYPWVTIMDPRPLSEGGGTYSNSYEWLLKGDDGHTWAQSLNITSFKYLPKSADIDGNDGRAVPEIDIPVNPDWDGRRPH